MAIAIINITPTVVLTTLEIMVVETEPDGVLTCMDGLIGLENVAVGLAGVVVAFETNGQNRSSTSTIFTFKIISYMHLSTCTYKRVHMNQSMHLFTLHVY